MVRMSLLRLILKLPTRMMPRMKGLLTWMTRPSPFSGSDLPTVVLELYHLHGCPSIDPSLPDCLPYLAGSLRGMGDTICPDCGRRVYRLAVKSGTSCGRGTSCIRRSPRDLGLLRHFYSSEAGKYNALDAEITWRLEHEIISRLKATDLWPSFYRHIVKLDQVLL